MAKPVDLSGQRFGRLTAIDLAPPKLCGGRHFRAWNCLCDCGNRTVCVTHALISGHTRSCGCVSDKHGMTGTKEYWVWGAMVARCTNPKNVQFKDYGGRGITVSPEWMRFANFIADMGERPSPGATLDRIDNNKGYSRENCRWAPRAVQAKNKRMYSANKSGVTGVEWDAETSKWRARIRVDNRLIHIGRFRTLDEAKAAREVAEVKYGFSSSHGRAA